MKYFFRKLTVILSVFCLIAFSFIIYGEIKLPLYTRICDGGELSFFGIYKTDLKDDVFPVFNNEINQMQNDTTVSLFGVIPVKKCSVETSDRDYVALGGDLIGIRIYTSGVVVLANETIGINGKTENPGENAGLKKGDIITSVNGKNISTCNELTDFVNNSDGKVLELGVNRNGKKFNTGILPLQGENDGRYHIGLWVRDSSAGIGTLTFTDIETGMFASLGHAICDADTNIILPVGGGDILSANINTTVKGQVGATGEIKGSFSGKVLGKLMYNGSNGIYGVFSDKIKNAELIPVAENNEIKTGHAEILSTLETGKKEYYDIVIEKIDYSDNANSHNMTIRVTDERLIEKTGGIIQGMSGSPIIQNGKLVGAVTHVFMNDPQMGYGIFARNMLDTCETLYKSAA